MSTTTTAPKARARDEGERHFQARAERQARADDALRALAKYVADHGQEAFDRELLIEFTVSLMALADQLDSTIEEIVDEAYERFTSIGDPLAEEDRP